MHEKCPLYGLDEIPCFASGQAEAKVVRMYISVTLVALTPGVTGIVKAVTRALWVLEMKLSSRPGGEVRAL